MKIICTGAAGGEVTGFCCRVRLPGQPLLIGRVIEF
jgi:hypothetical protein